MATSRKRINQLVKQCEQLSQLASNFNKNIEQLIVTASHDMNQQLSSIKQNVEEATNAIVDDFNDWEKLKTNLLLAQLPDRVTLNVGGRYFETALETLTKEKDTFFTALFSNNWEMVKDKDERIFIDRDGDLFAEILEFMRNPDEFVMPDERLRKRLVNEAKFYQLKSFLEILTEPDRKKEEEEQRNAQLFAGDTLLTNEQKQKLNKFYRNPNQCWQLIYKATRDGFEAATFHRLCDNRGPTMVIIQSSDDYLFGGYASKSWNSSGNYINAPNSFLFLLTNANGSPPTKFTYNNDGNALNGDKGHGPVFGSGHDLHICSGSNIKNDSYCNLPRSYQNPLGLAESTFTGSKNFITSEIEVFKLSE